MLLRGVGEELTQIRDEAVKVRGKVYGSSGVGEKRKKGYISGGQWVTLVQ